MNWWSAFKFNCLSCILYAAFSQSDDDCFVCSSFSISAKMASIRYYHTHPNVWFHRYNQFKSTSTDEIHFQRLKFIKFTKLRVCKIRCEIRRNAFLNLCKHAPYPKLRTERHCLHFILMHYLYIAYIEES